MASIRILKKDINRFAFDLLQECFSYSKSNANLLISFFRILMLAMGVVFYLCQK